MKFWSHVLLCCILLVFAALPAADDGAREVLELLVAHLTSAFPQVYRKTGSQLVNTATHETWNLAKSHLHPLELAGRLVQEDLCLLGRASGDNAEISTFGRQPIAFS